MDCHDDWAVAFGLDRSEVTEYRPNARIGRRTKLYNHGDGLAVAVRNGVPMPRNVREHGPWAVAHFDIDGWDILITKGD